MKRLIQGIGVSAGLLAMLIAGQCAATPLHVFIDTSSFGSITVGATFDFIDGAPVSNDVEISNFSTNGTLGTSTSAGGVTGGLPSRFTLKDSSFFNEYYQPITSATKISFDFNPTTTAPNAGSLPDTISFLLLDDTTGLPLFDTTDPTGAATLFTMQIDGSDKGLLSVYAPASINTTVNWTVGPIESNSSVPEPNTILLLAVGAATAGLSRRRPKLP